MEFAPLTARGGGQRFNPERIDNTSVDKQGMRSANGSGTSERTGLLGSGKCPALS